MEIHTGMIVYCQKERAFATLEAGFYFMDDGHKIWPIKCPLCDDEWDTNTIDDDTHLSGEALIMELETLRNKS